MNRKDKRILKEKYLKVKKQVLKITDGLGKHIDPGMIELVTYLNLMDIRTTGSCEGHSDRGNGYFWVSFRFWGYGEMNDLLRGCFGRKRPFEYTFARDTQLDETIIFLEPIMKTWIKRSKKDLNKFEKYLKKKYFSQDTNKA